jgi:glycosyltransferase involved in cell wall biosynthesis
MTERGIVFVDANSLWHRRLAEALGRIRPTIAFEPAGAFLPRRIRTRRHAGEAIFVSATLLRGWSSKTAFLGQRQLAAMIVRAARGLGGSPAVILTSPKYRLLARLLAGRFPLVCYCADDYREYEGWDGRRMAEAEAEIAGRVQLSVFVSVALRERALKEHGISERAALTSPNATEPRFLASRPRAASGGMPFPMKRPVLGVLGGLTRRLDLALVRRAAEIDTVGTLLIAGYADEDVRRQEGWISGNPKVHVTGLLPHDVMHRYARAMDAALIPYRPTAFNRFCSPMRLYDHLASGVPIIATDACDQINRLGVDTLAVAPAPELPEIARAVLRNPPPDESRRPTEVPGGLLWSDRAERLAAAIDRL